MTAAAINPTPDQVSRMVILSFGQAALSGELAGRYADVARDALAGRVPPENDAAAAFLEELREAAEEREIKRVSDLTAVRAETAQRWAAFDEQRAAASLPPEGRRFISVRDEATGHLHKLAVPLEWFTPIQK